VTEYAWDLQQKLEIPPLGVQLSSSSRTGAGLNPDLAGREDIRVAFRQGGETCRPAGRGGHRRELKKLLQEWGVPPWRRQCVPLLFVGDEIAAVLGYTLCDPFAVGAGAEGLHVEIHPSTRPGIATEGENNDNTSD